MGITPIRTRMFWADALHVYDEARHAELYGIGITCQRYTG